MNSPVDTAHRSKAERKIRERPCYLHDVYARSEHARSLYNLCWLIFIVLGAQAIWQDYVMETGLLRVATVITNGFTHLPYALVCWLALHVLVLVVLYGFRVWAWLYRKTNTKNFFRGTLNSSAALLFVVLQFGNFAVGQMFYRQYDFHFALRVAICAETVRLAMKMHAFVRSSAGSVIACHSTPPQAKWRPPSWRHYAYYLFAPTLVYAASYTRSSSPRVWSRLLWGIAEIAATIVLAAIYYSRLVHPYFADFGLQTPLDYRSLVDAMLYMAVPSFPLIFLVFYVIIHSAQNVFAELLNFPDRQFYTQWWCSSSLSEFYPRENELIQTFIHLYIYTDLKELPGFRGRRWLTTSVTICLSGILHDYMGVAALGVFLPLFTVLMLAPLFMTPLAVLTPKGVGNFWMLAATFVGSSVIFTALFMEAYAKRNCPRENVGHFDFLVPYIYTCFHKDPQSIGDNTSGRV